MQVVKVGGRTISITNSSKVLFPKAHITKEDILQYYMEIAGVMLPHMKNHLIVMQRFPNGVGDEGFFQKNISDYFPAWIKSVSVKNKNEGEVHYVLCNDAATLVYLANQGCLTPHLWLSKKDKLHYPDRLIFDLDPSKNDFSLVKKAAFLLKKLLEDLELVSYVMLTGAHGVHVVVPLKRRYDFEQVHAFSLAIAKRMIDHDPRMFTLEMRKIKRRGRVFIDTLRNGYGATAVAPYAVRAQPYASIATPITWRELHNTTTSQRYTIKTVLKRIDQKGDSWEAIDKNAQSLVHALKKLNALIDNT